MFGIIQKMEKAAATHSATMGRVLLNGAASTGATAPRVCSELHSCLLDREQAGMLFHHSTLYTHMQGSQNLAFPSKKTEKEKYS